MSEPSFRGSLNTTVVLLHCLGGSARTWDDVREALDPTLDVVAIDLAGFGASRDQAGWTVEEMSDAGAAQIKAAVSGRWIIVGHSMGGKIAGIVARRSEGGESGLGGLAGVLLLAGSPPEPEPMDEPTREEMRSWFYGPPSRSRTEAEQFVRQNIASDVMSTKLALAADDVLRSNPLTWRAWLDRGSREDWSGYVGLVQCPATLAAGAEDGPLGVDRQRQTAAQHFENSRVVIVEGAKHLLPLERPAEIAALIHEQVSFAREGEQRIPAGYADLMNLHRVSARTRRTLVGRAALDNHMSPRALSAAQFETLRAVVDRIVPQVGDSIPLAIHIDELLAKGAGDGWRFGDLPQDLQAYADGLETLEGAARLCFGAAFAESEVREQDDLLSRASKGQIAGRLTAQQMRHWFQDVSADAVRAYVAHPATLARIGYSGIANGGDGMRKEGFAVLHAGEAEPWEPRPGPDHEA